MTIERYTPFQTHETNKINKTATKRTHTHTHTYAKSIRRELTGFSLYNKKLQVK